MEIRNSFRETVSGKSEPPKIAHKRAFFVERWNKLL